jgi:hypothetical protein
VICFPHTRKTLPVLRCEAGEHSHATSGPTCSGAKVSKPSSGLANIGAVGPVSVIRVRALGMIALAVTP